MEAAHQAPGSAGNFRGNPLFRCGLDPMLLVDDDRRCVDANAAACLFLRRPLDAIHKLTIDDLTAPDLPDGLDTMWLLLLQGEAAMEDLPRDMRMPDGTTVAIYLSVVPRVGPGRHLAIIRFPAARACLAAAAPPGKALSEREREVLRLVALGSTGAQIAGQLSLSPATVQTHVVNALMKLGAKNRAHGIALALQTYQLDLDKTLLQLSPRSDTSRFAYR